jgi:hypothetical protein
LVPLLEQNGLSAQGTFPGIVTEQRIDISLQKAFPHQPAHFAPAFCAVHVSFPHQLAMKVLTAQPTVLHFPQSNHVQ